MEIMRDGRSTQRVEIYHPAEIVTALINSGTSITSDINTAGLMAMGVSIPSEWDAANLTVLVSSDLGATYQPMYDGNGNEYTITAAANEYILLDPSVFGVIRYFQFRSGTAGTPINQTANRSLIIHLG